MSEADIRLELAREEENSAANNPESISLHEVTPTAMLATLLDLEEQQYVIALAWTIRVCGPYADADSASSIRLLPVERPRKLQKLSANALLCDIA